MSFIVHYENGDYSWYYQQGENFWREYVGKCGKVTEMVSKTEFNKVLRGEW